MNHLARGIVCVATVAATSLHSHSIPQDPQLFNAAERGDLEEVRALVSRGADPNTNSLQGFSSLQAAASKGHLEVAMYLLEKGADVNYVSEAGRATPLISAIGGGNLQLVKLLIEKGARVDHTAEQGITVLHAAAIRPGDKVEIFDIVVKNGGDVKKRTKGGLSTLMLAVGSNNAKIAARILELDPGSARESDDNGRTPLLLAKQGKFSEIEAILRAAGAER